MESLYRTVYIGLGGAGIKSILKTKELFIESYGQVPPMIRFIGIDTDPSELDTKDGVKLNPHEKCLLSPIRNANDFYKAYRDELTLPNQSVLESLFLRNHSAMAIRSIGRFAFIYDVNRVKSVIEQAFHDVRTIDADPNINNIVQIHISFSFAGGTGAGIFLDLAYLIRKICQDEQVLLFGYGILPQVFVDMSPSSRTYVIPNGYAALQDLDFLMSLNSYDEPVSFNWISESYTQEDFRMNPKPFDKVYLYGNTNEKGRIYSYNNIIESIGKALFISSTSKIGDLTISHMESLTNLVEDGEWDIGNKKAWVSSFGISDIVFIGNKVAATYALKVTISMIQRALNSREDGNYLATMWIDQISIREDYGQDQVIDALCDKRPKQILDISNQKEPKPEVDFYCENIIKRATESAEKAKKDLEAKVLQSLAKTVSGYLKSGDCFVTTTKDFICNVKSQIEIFIGEMEEEKVGFENKTDILKQELDIAVKTLKDEANKGLFFRFRSHIENANEETVLAAANYVENEIEIIRRLYAVQFFNTILKELAKHQNSVDNIEGFLNDLKIQYTATLNKMTAASRTSTMEVDIAEDIIRSLKVDDATLLFNDFYQFVGEDGLESVATTEEMEQIFYNYAKSRPEYSEWQGKTVSEVIDSLSEEEFFKACQKVAEKAEPLIRVDSWGKFTNSGRRIDEIMCNYQFIAIDDRDNNRLIKDKSFINNIDSIYRTEFVSTHIKGRIFFCIQKWIFPPFLIKEVKHWKEYEKIGTHLNYHFDTNIQERMRREQYSLFPLFLEQKD